MLEEIRYECARQLKEKRTWKNFPESHLLLILRIQEKLNIRQKEKRSYKDLHAKFVLQKSATLT